MPNGRSGGFPIDRDTLRRLIGHLAGDVKVGMLLRKSQRPESVTVAKLATLIETVSGPQIAVEEQDHSAYILHLQNSPESVWVGVHGASPLLPLLRQQHEAWNAEHPHDRSWMGF